MFNFQEVKIDNVLAMRPAVNKSLKAVSWNASYIKANILFFILPIFNVPFCNN